MREQTGSRDRREHLKKHGSNGHSEANSNCGLFMDETSPTYQVHLPLFEGPLDLLLHLIKINELDIYDIPIAVITDQYLEYLDLIAGVGS